MTFVDGTQTADFYHVHMTRANRPIDMISDFGPKDLCTCS